MKTALAILDLAFSLSWSLMAFAASPVWKISKGAEQVYLGGTVHVLSAADYPLPEPFERAYQASELLIFEVNQNDMMSPQSVMKLQAALVYDDRRTLHGALSSDVYEALERHLALRKMAISTFEKFNPVGMVLTLTVLELQRLGVTSEDGVENYFTSRANQDDKSLGALETAEEQIQFIQAMSDSNADALVKSTLADLRGLEVEWANMVTVWRSGNAQEMQALMMEPMREEFPKIYQLLLVQRNIAWLEKIAAMFSTPEIEFVLVGALHMVGPDGLLALLEKQGYRVQQLH